MVEHRVVRTCRRVDAFPTGLLLPAAFLALVSAGCDDGPDRKSSPAGEDSGPRHDGGTADDAGEDSDASTPGSVIPPTFQPPGGSYPGPLTVTLSTLTPGSEIEVAQGPDEEQATVFRPYTGPIAVSGDTVLRARASRPGLQTSRTVTARYRIGGPATDQLTGTVTVVAADYWPRLKLGWFRRSESSGRGPKVDVFTDGGTLAWVDPEEGPPLEELPAPPAVVLGGDEHDLQRPFSAPLPPTEQLTEDDRLVLAAWFDRDDDGRWDAVPSRSFWADPGSETARIPRQELRWQEEEEPFPALLQAFYRCPAWLDRGYCLDAYAEAGGRNLNWAALSLQENGFDGLAITADIPNPLEVSELQAEAAGSGTIRLSWQAPQDPLLIGVQITVFPVPAEQPEPMTLPRGTPEVLVQGLENNVEYTFHVRTRAAGEVLSPGRRISTRPHEPFLGEVVGEAGWSPGPAWRSALWVQGPADIDVVYEEELSGGPLALGHWDGRSWQAGPRLDPSGAASGGSAPFSLVRAGQELLLAFPSRAETKLYRLSGDAWQPALEAGLGLGSGIRLSGDDTGGCWAVTDRGLGGGTTLASYHGPESGWTVHPPALSGNSGGAGQAAVQQGQVLMAYEQMSESEQDRPIAVERFHSGEGRWEALGRTPAGQRASEPDLVIAGDGTPYLAYLRRGDAEYINVQRLGAAGWEPVGAQDTLRKANSGRPEDRGHSLTVAGPHLYLTVAEYEPTLFTYLVHLYELQDDRWASVGFFRGEGYALLHRAAGTPDGTLYVLLRDEGRDGRLTLLRYR